MYKHLHMSLRHLYLDLNSLGVYPDLIHDNHHHGNHKPIKIFYDDIYTIISNRFYNISIYFKTDDELIKMWRGSSKRVTGMIIIIFRHTMDIHHHGRYHMYSDICSMWLTRLGRKMFLGNKSKLGMTTIAAWFLRHQNKINSMEDINTVYERMMRFYENES